MWTRIFPFLKWFERYSAPDLRADLISGLTVALVLIPQSMAYAQLAGLPVYYGLYAAFLPPMVAALFGSSHQLATGPVAVVSLMTATALEPLATAGGEAFIAYAIFLALLVGIFQFALGVLRLGLVVNFLSHPVVNGFTNAAALIIASSQLAKLFGVEVDNAEHHYETVLNVFKAAMVSTHWPTLGLAVLAFVIMVVMRRVNPRIPNVLVAVVVTTMISWAGGFEHSYKGEFALIASPYVKKTIEEYNGILNKIEEGNRTRIPLNDKIEDAKKANGSHSVAVMEFKHHVELLNLKIAGLKEESQAYRSRLRALDFAAVEESKGKLRFYTAGELPADLKTDGRRWRLKVGNRRLQEKAITFVGGGSVVGEIPRGLPGFTLPKINFTVMLSLFPMAAIISLLGFMEAISIAKAMAARTGQRLDPNQELIGQGLANIIGSLGRGYPVSGSFSRSAVNIQAGAVTGMSSVFTSGVVVVALLFFTPLLYHLPQSVLAAIIMMAVVGLINVRGFIHTWQAQRYDGVIAVISFVGTLIFAPHLDRGILIGVVLSIGLYLLRNMRPDMAMLSKYTDGTYRNAARFGLEQCRHIAVIRFNSSLFFANVNYLEERVLEEVASMPELKHILIIGHGINELDASGEEMLSLLVGRLREAGYDVSLAGLNDAVLDVLKRTHLYEKIGEDHIFHSIAMAIEGIHEPAHRGSQENECPLLTVCFKGLPVSPGAKRRPIIQSRSQEPE
ncbi:MAG: sodium-independent anion transporter [Syntrophaceae bacterium CG2_30_49_12]|nr:MAG: sodium-independent anion transporter [Syntrophaceae bacterium CG2_30_49_12]